MGSGIKGCSNLFGVALHDHEDWKWAYRRLRIQAECFAIGSIKNYLGCINATGHGRPWITRLQSREQKVVWDARHLRGGLSIQNGGCNAIIRYHLCLSFYIQYARGRANLGSWTPEPYESPEMKEVCEKGQRMVLFSQNMTDDSYLGRSYFYPNPNCKFIGLLILIQETVRNIQISDTLES